MRAVRGLRIDDLVSTNKNITCRVGETSYLISGDFSGKNEMCGSLERELKVMKVGIVFFFFLPINLDSTIGHF